MGDHWATNYLVPHRSLNIPTESTSHCSLIPLLPVVLQHSSMLPPTFDSLFLKVKATFLLAPFLPRIILPSSIWHGTPKEIIKDELRRALQADVMSKLDLGRRRRSLLKRLLWRRKVASTVSGNMLRFHVTGSARTEGFYKITHAEKATYVTQYQARAATTSDAAADSTPRSVFLHRRTYRRYCQTHHGFSL